MVYPGFPIQWGTGNPGGTGGVQRRVKRPPPSFRPWISGGTSQTPHWLLLHAETGRKSVRGVKQCTRLTPCQLLHAIEAGRDLVPPTSCAAYRDGKQRVELTHCQILHARGTIGKSDSCIACCLCQWCNWWVGFCAINRGSKQARDDSPKAPLHGEGGGESIPPATCSHRERPLLLHFLRSGESVMAAVSLSFGRKHWGDL